MNNNKNHEDVFDSLFEKHMNDEQFINSSISDFGKMIKEAIDEEAQKNGYDSLSEMIQDEIKSNFSANQSTDEVSYSNTSSAHHTRYDIFIHSIETPVYLLRHHELYQNGYEDALKRYRQQAELNRNNLCPLEKIIQEEINGASNLKQDSYGQGYLDGLRLIQRNLLQSKSIMMEKVNYALMDAMNKK